jgi:hypothetical protein
MALPPFLARIIDWLRAGYPNGVAGTDRRVEVRT